MKASSDCDRKGTKHSFSPVVITPYNSVSWLPALSHLPSSGSQSPIKQYMNCTILAREKWGTGNLRESWKKFTLSKYCIPEGQGYSEENAFKNRLSSPSSELRVVLLLLLFLFLNLFLLLQECFECMYTMITDKEHLVNSNILFFLPCIMCTLVLMSHWLSSFPPASDLIMSIALFKNSHSHSIILFLGLHDYHCFTVPFFTVSVFWQFSVVSSLFQPSYPSFEDTEYFVFVAVRHIMSTANFVTSWLKAFYNTS